MMELLAQKNYRESLENLPPSGGNGCHPGLLGVANHARKAGVSREQVFADLQRETLHGERKVTDREISEAVNKAYNEDEATFNREYEAATSTPRKLAPEIDISMLPPAQEKTIVASSPVEPSTDPEQQKRQLIECVFEPDEWVYIGARESITELGKNMRPCRKWLEQEKIPGEFYVCNPFTGKLGKTQDEKPSYRAQNVVADHRNLVVEFDEATPQEQLGCIEKLIQCAPVVAVYFSGGKSYHALLRIGGGSADEYRARVAQLRPYLVAIGADKACFHAARLTRLPGAYRRDKKEYQRLIYVNPEPEGTWETLLAGLMELDNNVTIEPRTFEEQMRAAKALTDESDPEEIEKLAREAAALSSIKKRQVLQTIKKRTGIPLSTLTDAIKEEFEKEDVDHLDLARELVDATGSENVISVPVGVYCWQSSGVWKRQEQRAIKQLVQQFVGDSGKLKNVQKSNVDSISDLFTNEIFKPEHEFNIGERDTVNCLNGELSCCPELEHAFILEPHRRESYRTTQIPVEYDAKATAPRFEQFMQEIFKGDADAQDKAQAVLEMMGYSLMAHCNHEKFVILVGTGANGKTVLLHILAALCGFKNVAGVQPAEFDNKFQRAHLLDKLANIVTEIRQGEVINDAALKAIVSGEATTVEHKHKDPFEMHPFSTCWFGTNHMPHTRDFSDALFRRALVVEFNQVFKPENGNCDPNLKDKLLAELPGILNLALDAYTKALTDGFTMPESCIRARDDWKLEADQVAQFVNEACNKHENGEESITMMFRAYKHWAEANGIHKTMSLKGFRDRLTRLGFGKGRNNKGRTVTGLNLHTLCGFTDVSHTA